MKILFYALFGIAVFFAAVFILKPKDRPLQTTSEPGLSGGAIHKDVVSEKLADRRVTDSEPLTATRDNDREQPQPIYDEEPRQASPTHAAQRRQADRRQPESIGIAPMEAPEPTRSEEPVQRGFIPAPDSPFNNVSPTEHNPPELRFPSSDMEPSETVPIEEQLEWPPPTSDSPFGNVSPTEDNAQELRFPRFEGKLNFSKDAFGNGWKMGDPPPNGVDF